uniref:Fanconi-associated nuclease n=1 Tax=Echinostoma caproni TaxID=27848 RepID=A0A183B6I8_9TREM
LWFEATPPPLPSTNSSPPTLSERNSEEAHTLLLTVEQWTLRHYTNRLEYERGLHSESRVFHLIFLLLFYDILFDDTIPDVFYSYRQSEPLDLCSDDFYPSRRSAIDERLSWISQAELPPDDTVNRGPKLNGLCPVTTFYTRGAKYTKRFVTYLDLHSRVQCHWRAPYQTTWELINDAILNLRQSRFRNHIYWKAEADITPQYGGNDCYLGN